MNYVILRNISNVVTMKRYPNHATDDSMVDNQIGIITTPNLKVSNNPRCKNIIYGTYGDPYDAQKYKIRCLLCVLPFQYSDMDLYFLDHNLVSITHHWWE